MADQSQRSGLVLLIAASAAFMASLDVFIVNVAFDAIRADFRGTTLAELSWVLSGYAIVYAALLVPAGRIADRYGRKGAFLAGLVLFTLASAGCAASGGVWWLVGFRVLQAIGAAILTPASLGLVVASIAPAQRQRAVRIWAATGALAAALGPAVGGLLIEASWRWVFLVNVPVGLAALVAALRFVPRSRDEDAAALPDLLGAWLLVAGIGALTVGVVKGPDWGWTAGSTLSAWVVCCLSLVGFVVSSVRHRAPVIDPAMIRVRAFAWSNVTALLFGVPFAGALLVTILWMQQVWGYSAMKTGFAIAPGPLMVPVFAVLTHRLARRVPIGVLVSVGCLLCAIGSLVAAGLVGPEPHYLSEILPGWLIAGAGVGLALPSILSSATADLAQSQAATGSAVVNMSRQVGTALGVSIVVAVLGTPNGYRAVHTAFQHAWLANAVVAVLAAASALGMTPRRGSSAVALDSEPVTSTSNVAVR